MISIDTFRKQLITSANKWRSGTIPPAKMDLFLEQASMELFNEKVGSASKNGKLDDDLAPFLRSVNLPVKVVEGLNYGLTIRPVDYNYFWSMRAFFSQTEKGELVSCGCPSSDNKECDATSTAIETIIPLDKISIVKEVQVIKVDSGRWSSVLQHRFKAPTLDKPYCTQYDAGFKVAPRNLNVVTFDYYRKPVPAHFGYTLLTGGYYQYDAANSTNIEWPAQVLNELLDRTMIIFSGYLKDQQMFQYAETQKATRI